MSRLRRVSLVVLGASVAALALIGVLSITRGTPVARVVTLSDSGPPPVTDSLFERTFELFTGTHVYPGNVVTQALNGDGTYPRLWADLRSAQRTITVQMYYSLPGKVADTLAAILKERARAHVRVLLLLDAFGSQHLSRDWIRSLRDAGVEVAKLRRLRWFTIHDAGDRSHVRVVVVDGRIGWTGGFGLADYWLGDGHHVDQWRESNVRFAGPSVMELQAAFAAAWAESTGELLTGSLFFPPGGFQRRGDDGRRIPVHRADYRQHPRRTLPRAFICSAARKRSTSPTRTSCLTTTFGGCSSAPRRRGVDVRVLTASANTDVKTTWYAGRYRYEELLGRGVRIYEYQPTMLHSKTIIVDGLWGSIGSMNFDNRSIAFNDESNLVVLDSAFGAQMDSVFLDDLRYSKEIKLDEFRVGPCGRRCSRRERRCCHALL